MSLQLRDVVLEINGRVLVNRVSLELSPGEVVGLLGPNGAGKTTTFGLVTGLIEALLEQGRVIGADTQVDHLATQATEHAHHRVAVAVKDSAGTRSVAQT